MSKETDSESEPQQLQYKARHELMTRRGEWGLTSAWLSAMEQVIILGDGAVGKTSIAMRHTEDSFSNMYKQTIGLDFFLKRLALPGTEAVSHSCVGTA